jgi:hypothetical protein
VAPAAKPADSPERLGESVIRSGANFLIALRGLLTLLIYLAPWLLLAVPLAFGIRALLRRFERLVPVQPDEAAVPD